MEIDSELNNFAIQLQQNIIDIADAEDAPSMRAEAFTQYMIDELTETGELEDGRCYYHASRGIEVSGYNLGEDGTLDLFTTNFTQVTPPETIGKSEVEAYFRRLTKFLQKALDKYYTEIEESSHAFDMAEHIYVSFQKQEINRVRLYFFTDGLTTLDKLSNIKLYDLPVAHHIWDLRRLYRANSSGKRSEPIQIDFIEQFGAPLPCLQGADSSTDYSAYLTIIPGNILSDLYGSYGARLLELNVRSFLQNKVKVNQGIRRTILDEPERFLAYNNGISATASNIELVNLPGGGLGIKSLSDLQIVNGGQTTASIYNTVRKDKADVSGIKVQAKISVVSSDEIVSMVPLISRYANSQNKVNEADFSANDPFHVNLEKLARSIWAPAAHGTQRQTMWFYERARGQYQDALNREGTAARQKQFKEIHPTTQKFTKTDLAKYELTWEQLPQVVSQGSQKCFTQFTTRLQKRGNFEADQQYFQHLVAKAILFRQAEKIVAIQNLGGYRANIVTYTLAYIIHHTGSRIDLSRIWQQQSLGQGLRETIEHVSRQVREAILQSPDGKNITEWCKKPACWDKIRVLDIDFPASLDKELLASDTKGISLVDKGIEGPSPKEQEMIIEVASIPTETWFQLSSWAKETHNLLPWQRSLATSLGIAKGRGKMPTLKQSKQGIIILEEASRLGFKLEVAS